MPPIIKDSDTLTTAPESATRANSAGVSPSDSAVKQQPVALEIPITVNGARTVEGSEKREPFSESTKTVMVHGSGAVIRLTSSMAPGQLLFLTNERTKKEVVCQVVKSKNYRNVSGYVELEFTEPAVGFWGMRFPGDQIGPGPQAAPATVSPSAGNSEPTLSRPVPAKREQPSAGSRPSSVTTKPSTPAPISAKPAAPATTMPSIVPPAPTFGPDEPLVEPWLKKREPASRVPAAPPPVAPEPAAKSAEPESNRPTVPNFELSRPSDQPASLFAPPEAPANLSKVDLSSVAPFFEVKPAAGDAAPSSPQMPAPNNPQTEELKHHTARLQEELAKIQFAEPVSSSPAQLEAEIPSFPLTEQSASDLKAELVHESKAQLLENSVAADPAPLLPEPPELVEPSKDAPSVPIPALESMQQEELKIPAWLEPLARNASAPSSTQELVLREKTKRIAEQPQLEALTARLGPPAEKAQVGESRVPQFGSALPFEEAKSVVESAPKKSGKGMLFAAVTAGILALAGGGWWYLNQQSPGVHAGVPAAQAPSVSAAAQDSQTNSTKEAALGSMFPVRGDAASSEAKPTTANSNTPVNSATSLSTSTPANSPASAVRNPQATSNTRNDGNVVTTAESASPEAAREQVKKSVLGEVHLAAPKISPKRTVQAGTEADAGISLSEDQPEANADALGAGSGIANSQPTAPAAPVAVGGDVKQAKLMSSTPPVYPAVAKAQHVSGSVTIDALIDATGRVTATKIVSGPGLLQQAAIDALKQWKYQPATLDGKPVPMHLTVTIQFRLQQ